jgi:hypothetical protein
MNTLCSFGKYGFEICFSNRSNLHIEHNGNKLSTYNCSSLESRWETETNYNFQRKFSNLLRQKHPIILTSTNDISKFSHLLSCSRWIVYDYPNLFSWILSVFIRKSCPDGFSNFTQNLSFYRHCRHKNSRTYSRNLFIMYFHHLYHSLSPSRRSLHVRTCGPYFDNHNVSSLDTVTTEPRYGLNLLRDETLYEWKQKNFEMRFIEKKGGGNVSSSAS